MPFFGLLLCMSLLPPAINYGISDWVIDRHFTDNAKVSARFRLPDGDAGFVEWLQDLCHLAWWMAVEPCTLVLLCLAGLCLWKGPSRATVAVIGLLALLTLLVDEGWIIISLSKSRARGASFTWGYGPTLITSIVQIAAAHVVPIILSCYWLRRRSGLRGFTGGVAPTQLTAVAVRSVGGAIILASTIPLLLVDCPSLDLSSARGVATAGLVAAQVAIGPAFLWIAFRATAKRAVHFGRVVALLILDTVRWLAPAVLGLIYGWGTLKTEWVWMVLQSVHTLVAFPVLLAAGLYWWREPGRRGCDWVMLKDGLCVTCGYNLTGNVSGRCPECGQPVVNSGREEVQPESSSRQE